MDTSWLPWAAFAGVGIVITNATARFTWQCRHRLRRRPVEARLPQRPSPVTLFVACKAAPAHLRQALESLLTQDHPNYETVFTLASETDPAYAVASDLAQRFSRCRVVVAGYSDHSAEKTNNLVAAIRTAPDSSVYAFADSDIQVQPDWLRRLICPLQERTVGVTTAAKVPWLAADAGFWASAFIRLFFSTQALAFGMPTLCLAWGGSMAIRREVFNRLGIDERWARAVDDDISVSRYVRDAGLQVHFVQMFVPTRVPTHFTQAFNWAVRQMQYLYLYYRLAWFTVAFLTVLPTLALGVLGAWYCDCRGVLAHEQLGSALSFFLSLHMFITGAIFHAVHRVSSRCEESQGWGRFPVIQALLSPITVAVAACASVMAALRKTMVWGGVTYLLEGPEHIVVLSRASDLSAVGPFEPAPLADDPLTDALTGRPI